MANGQTSKSALKALALGAASEELPFRSCLVYLFRNALVGRRVGCCSMTPALSLCFFGCSTRRWCATAAGVAVRCPTLSSSNVPICRSLMYATVKNLTQKQNNKKASLCASFLYNSSVLFGALLEKGMAMELWPEAGRARRFVLLGTGQWSWPLCRSLLGRCSLFCVGGGL